MKDNFKANLKDNLKNNLKDNFRRLNGKLSISHDALTAPESRFEFDGGEGGSQAGPSRNFYHHESTISLQEAAIIADGEADPFKVQIFLKKLILFKVRRFFCLFHHHG